MEHVDGLAFQLGRQREPGGAALDRSEIEQDVVLVEDGEDALWGLLAALDVDGCVEGEPDRLPAGRLVRLLRAARVPFAGRRAHIVTSTEPDMPTPPGCPWMEQ